MLIPSRACACRLMEASLSRRVNANSQQYLGADNFRNKLIKKGEC